MVESANPALSNSDVPTAEPLGDSSRGNLLSRALRYVKGEATRMAGFTYIAGDVMIALSGLFMPNGAGSERNLLKVVSGALGLANSISYLSQESWSPDADVIVGKLDDALAQVSAGEAARKEVDKLHSTVEKLKTTEGAVELLRENGDRLGSAFSAVGSALNVVSGLRRANSMEAMNGLLNTPAFGVIAAQRSHDIWIDKPEPEAEGSYAQKRLGYAKELLLHKPSKIGGPMSEVGSWVGLGAGLRDMANERVPFMAGVLQFVGYGFYIAGDKFLARSSVGADMERESFLEREAMREDVYARSAAMLHEKAGQGMDETEFDHLLQSTSRYLAIETKLPMDMSLKKLQAAMEGQPSTARA